MVCDGDGAGVASGRTVTTERNQAAGTAPRAAAAADALGKNPTGVLLSGVEDAGVDDGDRAAGTATGTSTADRNQTAGVAARAAAPTDALGEDRMGADAGGVDGTQRQISDRDNQPVATGTAAAA